MSNLEPEDTDMSSSGIPRSDATLQELELLMTHEFFAGPQACLTKDNPRGRPAHAYHRIPNESIIRLLTIHPGSGKAAIQASLHYVPLSRTGPFEALSYAWGSSEKSCSIILQNCATPVTKSLYTALLRLRKPKSKRIMWIDALCIDQDDNDEKSLQVSIMYKIYSSAATVLCWLGEDEGHDGSQAVKLLRMVEGVHFGDLTDLVVTRDIMRSKKLPNKLDPIWFAARDFFDRPWFCRGWVIQEVVLGHNPVMVCADLQVPFTEVTNAVESLHEYCLIDWGTDCDRKPPASDGLASLRTMLNLKSMSTTGSAIVDMMRSYSNRDETAQRELAEGSVSRIPGLQQGVMMQRAISSIWGTPMQGSELLVPILDGMLEKMGIQTSVSQPLFDMLFLFRNSITTDPRDIFFSLLSLVTDREEPALRVDYNEPVRATLLRFARYFVLQSKNANGVRHSAVLTTAGIANRTGFPDLPSWAPEPLPTFPSGSIPLIMPGKLELGYHAAGNSATTYRAANDALTIIATGGLVDMISRVVRQPTWPPNIYGPGGLAVYREYFEEIDQVILLRETPYLTAAAGESLMDVQWRTLIGGVDRRVQTAGASLRDSYIRDRHRLDNLALYFEKLIETEDVDDFEADSMLGEWGQRWVSLTARHVVIETNGGLVGLAPIGANVGDRIYIFAGEKMPTILRPCEAESIGPSSSQVVGACYVHGIMQGEALRSTEWVEEEVWLV